MGRRCLAIMENLSTMMKKRSMRVKKKKWRGRGRLSRLWEAGPRIKERSKYHQS